MNEQDYQRWICEACGLIYDEAKGDPDSGLPPGTRYDDIPDDWQCPLCGMAKSDLRLLQDAPLATRVERPAQNERSKSRGGSEYVVIVGAGAAGWSAAEAIRRRDPQRPILLVSACKGWVYPKPAISLAISHGRSAEDLIDSDAQSRAEELGIEVLTETRILKINPQRKRITTTRGGIDYDKLVLALGAHQRELPIEGDAADTILRINDLSTFRTLEQQLRQGVNRITILGAGLIGCEFADDLTRAGYRVTVIDPNARPLSGLLPEPMALELMQRLSGLGVDWRLQATMQRLEHGKDSLHVVLSDGEAFATDLVISAAGLIANTELAKKAGLRVDVGISVDEDMRTSTEDIYAIGDCASVHGELYPFIEPIRRQAEAIAAHLVGEHEPFVSMPPMVKIKTQSMPMSVCRPSRVNTASGWKIVSNEKTGSHFEIVDAKHVVGFALSDTLASEAGSYYHKLSVNY